jgi:periplasmic glucans biosynthesis protein
MQNSKVGRRDFVRLALNGLAFPSVTLAGGAWPALGQTGPATTRPDQSPNFSFDVVIDLARALAAKPYKPPTSAELGDLANAAPEAAAAIKYRQDEMIWTADNLRYVIEPLHRSPNLPGEVELHIVDGITASRLAYDASKFDFGKLETPPSSARLGFSGFLVHHRGRDGRLRPVASVSNAAVLSAIARGQDWGAITRPLTVRSADQKTEIPVIRGIWIEKPSPSATALVMHALVDMPSVSGAFHFTVRAENAVLIDTECTIFARHKVDHFGLTPIHANHLVGPLSQRGQDDVRPAVYETTGVQMLSGRGEWIWRPVTNRDRLQVSAFVDNNPRGFGLVQRDRKFSTFLDDENDWQLRPTVWVEPIGEWGRGEITLLEIPATASGNKNIACYWRPKPGLEAGSETQFAYRQFWSWHPPARPDLAIVTISRTGRAPAANSEPRRRFLVQFSGKQLADPEPTPAIIPNVWASAGKIVAVRRYRTPKDGKMRVLFDLAPGNSPLVELRLVLEKSGRPVSETWLYRWTA